MRISSPELSSELQAYVSNYRLFAPFLDISGQQPDTKVLTPCRPLTRVCPPQKRSPTPVRPHTSQACVSSVFPPTPSPSVSHQTPSLTDTSSKIIASLSPVLCLYCSCSHPATVSLPQMPGPPRHCLLSCASSAHGLPQP